MKKNYSLGKFCLGISQEFHLLLHSRDHMSSSVMVQSRIGGKKSKVQSVVSDGRLHVDRRLYVIALVSVRGPFGKRKDRSLTQNTSPIAAVEAADRITCVEVDESTGSKFLGTPIARSTPCKAKTLSLGSVACLPRFRLKIPTNLFLRRGVIS